MPRTGKGQVAPGETYGDRQQLEQTMDAAPMAAAPPVDDGHLHQRAVEGATQMAPPSPEGGLLKQPSSRPQEPITAGMPIGAGPGQEALGVTATPQTERLRNQLQMAAEITGNPRIAMMAQRMIKRPQ